VNGSSRGVAVPAYRQRLGYQAGLLGGISLLASALLSIGDLQTRDDIALRKAEDLQASLAQVIPPSLHNNRLLDDTITLGDGTKVYRARNGDEVTAVAYQVSAAGYAGPITLVMGVDQSGAILAVRVISHTETPGLGDKMEKSKGDWIDTFEGRSLDNPPTRRWGVKKDGGEYDQFTGATITPRAIVKAIRGGLELFQRERSRLLAPPEGVSSEDAATAAADNSRQPAAGGREE
jgi:electron transport complex protein RnfG